MNNPSQTTQKITKKQEEGEKNQQIADGYLEALAATTPNRWIRQEQKEIAVQCLLSPEVQREEQERLDLTKAIKTNTGFNIDDNHKRNLKSVPNQPQYTS